VLDVPPRTYVFVVDPGVSPFPAAGFVAASRARRVVATSGPWLAVEAGATQGAALTAGPGQGLRAARTVWLDIALSQARFVHTERIRVAIGTPSGPALATTIDVPPNVRTHRWAGPIEVGPTDTWIGVTADGDTPLPIEQTGSYQQDRWHRPGVTPFAIASPILIDVDGDGRWQRGDANLALPGPR
jgi:hypothetical protein